MVYYRYRYMDKIETSIYPTTVIILVRDLLNINVE